MKRSQMYLRLTGALAATLVISLVLTRCDFARSGASGLQDAPLIRAPFPLVSLLTLSADATPLALRPGTLRRTRVDWHPEHLALRALSVRHGIEPKPGLKLEVVLDGELFTYAKARSWHGHLVDEAASHVTLTRYKERQWMTIDSAKYGVMAVRDERVVASGDETVSISSERDVLHTPFVRDDHGSFVEQLLYAESEKLKAIQTVTAATEIAAALAADTIRLNGQIKTAEAELLSATSNVSSATIALEAARRTPPDGVVVELDIDSALTQARADFDSKNKALTNAQALLDVCLRGSSVRPPPALTPRVDCNLQRAALSGAQRDKEAAQLRVAALTKAQTLRDLSTRLAAVQKARDDSAKKLQPIQSEQARVASAIAANVEVLQTARTEQTTANATASGMQSMAAKVRQERARFRVTSTPSRAANPANIATPTALNAAPWRMQQLAGATTRAPQVQRATFVAQNQANSGIPTPGTSALGPIEAMEWLMPGDCADPSGQIDVVAIISNKVWALAHTPLGATSAASTAITTVMLEGAVIHGIDTANTALKRSNISHPALDLGFRLVGINATALIQDDKRADEAFRSWSRYVSSPYSLDAAAVDTAAAGAVLVGSATGWDLVLSVIAGDDKIGTMRGMATIGDPDARNRRNHAVVKYTALDYPEVRTVAHELGHILGAGHDEVDQKTSGAKNDSYQDLAMRPYAHGSTALNGGSEATLMGVKPCLENQAKPDHPAGSNCRRVPYFSNQDVRLGEQYQISLGNSTTDNAGVMRLTRDQIARRSCARKVLAGSSVWLKNPPLEVPITAATTAQGSDDGQDSTRMPLPLLWESRSLWRRDKSERPLLSGDATFTNFEARNVYEHQNVAASQPAQFVSTMVNNPAATPATGTLAIWRINDAPGGGRWLSPQWSDLVALNNDAQTNGSTPCARASAPLLAAEGNVTTIEIPCVAGTFAAGDEGMFVRWQAVSSSQSAPFVVDPAMPLMAVASSPDTLWRSMTSMPLDLNESSTQTVVLRNAESTVRRVKLSIELALGQGNFNAMKSGITTVKIDAPNVAAICVNNLTTNLQCGGGGYGVNAQSQSFIVDAKGAEFDLDIPANTALLPVRIAFKRAVDPASLTSGTNINPPQTDVMFRVIESAVDASRIKTATLGGATVVMQAKRQ